MQNFKIYNFIHNSDFEKMTGKRWKSQKNDFFQFFDDFSEYKSKSMQNFIIFMVALYVKLKFLQYWSSKTIP